MRKVLALFLSFLMLAGTIAMDAQTPRRQRNRSKAKTTQTRKKSSSKPTQSITKNSGKSSTSSTRRRSAATATPAQVPAQQAQAETSVTRPAKGATPSKRKITVVKPDLEAIRKATLDPSNPMYFPKLMAKYNRNDTTMTNDEYRNLYLGYLFQEDYDPYRTSKFSGVTDDLRLKATHSKEEIDTIRKYAELALKDNPFDLRQMAFLVHVLKEKRKDMSAKIWEYRLEHLLGAIKSTGTGEDAENAWYVIYPVHEYDLIQVLGYEATDAAFLEPGYDYLTVQPTPETARKFKDKVAKGFYFNVVPIQEQYLLKHPEEANPSDADDIPAE